MIKIKDGGYELARSFLDMTCASAMVVKKNFS